MGLFSRRSKTSPASSSLPTFAPSSSSLSSKPSHSRASSRSHIVRSPNLTTTSPDEATIRLRVAVDPIPLKGHNHAAKELFHVYVDPESSVAALRREIARTVGHGSMSLFKVSIPHHAHVQSETYTQRYGKSVDLLARFPAFNLDDPAQLGLSLDSSFRAMSERVIASGDIKIKHWFPEQVNESSEIIQIIARPLLGMPINHLPLTLRAYFASPPQASSCAGPSSRSLPPPVVIDVNPYITVDELKSELLQAAGRDEKYWKSVTLWQIAMTEGEMNVIEELGRLKNGKMPWPYPPGAMEPIAMTDGNLPVSLFFPKSAPNGDMLNLSVWLDPACGAYDASATMKSTSTPTLRDIPHFRYPMTFKERPVSSSDLEQSISTSMTAEQPSALDHLLLDGRASRSKGRLRPSTAPATVLSEHGIPQVRAFGTSSKPPPLTASRSSNTARPTSAAPPSHTRSGSISRLPSKEPKGLGIVTLPAPLDRTSFSSNISSEDEAGLPSLSSSQQSLVTPLPTIVKTPDVEKSEWLFSPVADGVSLKKTSSLRGKVGSLNLKKRILRASGGSPLL